VFGYADISCFISTSRPNSRSRSCLLRNSLLRYTPFHSAGRPPARPTRSSNLAPSWRTQPSTAAGWDKASCNRPFHLLSHFVVQLLDPPANTFHNISCFPVNAIYINIRLLTGTIDNIKDVRRVQVTRALR
jgi:hypothetical protein